MSEFEDQREDEAEGYRPRPRNEDAEVEGHIKPSDDGTDGEGEGYRPRPRNEDATDGEGEGYRPRP